MADEESDIFQRMAGGAPTPSPWAWQPGDDPVPTDDPVPVDDSRPDPSLPPAPLDQDLRASAAAGPQASPDDSAAPVPPAVADGRFEHRSVEDIALDPVPSPDRSRLRVLLGAAVVILLAAVGWYVVAGGDDEEPSDVSVAGETSVKAEADTTVAPEVTGSTIVDPARDAAYAEEVRRACAVITADPGAVTEQVIRWDGGWSDIGKTERTLRDDVNNCALPARDAAMAAMAAREDAERAARVASCTFFDRAQVVERPGDAVGRCGVVGLRVVERREGTCEVEALWDTTGAVPPEGSGTPAVFQSGAGAGCPLLNGIEAGWTGKAWVTLAGVTQRGVGVVPLFTLEQSEAL